MTDIFELFAKIGKKNPTGPVTHLIVGLGNPGAGYSGTRHNTGFFCMDALAKSLGVEMKNSRFKALTCDTTIEDVRVLLMKPQTYMNLSGTSVQEAAAFYKIQPENIIVLCDDISFDVGHMRIRLKGSHGGHNGLRNIEACIHSDAYARIKIGVGKKPTQETDLAEWVLGHFTKEELHKFETEIAPHVISAIHLLLQGKPEEAMNQYSK